MPLIREGAARLGWERPSGLEIVGEAAHGRGAASRQLPSRRPHSVVLLDLSPARPRCLRRAGGTLREQHPQLRILARGELTNEHYVARAFDLGANGYLLKTSLSCTELVHSRGHGGSRPAVPVLGPRPGFAEPALRWPGPLHGATPPALSPGPE